MGVKTKIKKKKDKGQNVNIPKEKFLVIKAYADKNNIKMGGFIADAALEKIQLANG